MDNAAYTRIILGTLVGVSYLFGTWLPLTTCIAVYFFRQAKEISRHEAG